MVTCELVDASPPRICTTFSRRLLRLCRLLFSAERVLSRADSSSIWCLSSSLSAWIECNA